MRMLHILLVVRVDPLLFVVSCLRRLLHQVVLGHRAQLLFHLSVVQYLLPPNLLQLHRIQLILLLLLLTHHFRFTDLHFALQVDLIDLVLVQALEVVRFHAVWRQHAYFCLRVLSHEIMIICKLKLMMLLLSPSITLFLLTLSLFLSKNFIDVVCVQFILSSSLIVLFLGLFQNLVEFESLLIKECVDIFL